MSTDLAFIQCFNVEFLRPENFNLQLNKIGLFINTAHTRQGAPKTAVFAAVQEKGFEPT